MAGESRQKNRSTVLLEAIESEVRKVAEGHSSLVRGQHALQTDIGQLNARVGQVERAVIEGFKNVRDSIDGLTKRFDAHEHSHA